MPVGRAVAGGGHVAGLDDAEGAQGESEGRAVALEVAHDEVVDELFGEVLAEAVGAQVLGDRRVRGRAERPDAVHQCLEGSEYARYVIGGEAAVQQGAQGLGEGVHACAQALEGLRDVLDGPAELAQQSGALLRGGERGAQRQQGEADLGEDGLEGAGSAHRVRPG